MALNKKKILKDLYEILKEKYPDDIYKVILYGSQTSEKAADFSDYDILIILKNSFEWQLENAILDTCYEIDLKYDIVTDIQLISLQELSTIKGKQPYIQDALQYGLAV